MTKQRMMTGGPAPDGAGDADTLPIPIGLQQLLGLAAVDEAFRDELLARRDEMAEVAGVELTPSEVAILRSVSDEAALQMAASMPPPPPARREFLRQSAASAVLLLGGAAVADALAVGCKRDDGLPSNLDDIRTTGIRPDMPPERPDHNIMQGEGGADPGLPDDPVGDDDSAEDETPAPPEPTPAPPPKSRGISPDVPPRRGKDRS